MRALGVGSGSVLLGALNASVLWHVAPSVSVHELLFSADISPILREIISLPGWVSGHSVCLLIEWVSGSGVRRKRRHTSAEPCRQAWDCLRNMTRRKCNTQTAVVSGGEKEGEEIRSVKHKPFYCHSVSKTPLCSNF